MFFGSVFSVGTAPYVITCLLKGLNANLTQMALLPFIVQCGGCLGLPLACSLWRLESKSATILLLFLGRTFVLILTASLLLPFCRGNSGPLLVISLYALSVVISSASSGPATAWFKDILPLHRQSSFIGWRNAFGGLVIAVLTPLFGLLLDKGALSGLATSTLFTVLMLIPLVAGFLDLYFLGRVAGSGTSTDSSSFKSLKRLVHDLKNPALWKASLLPVISQGAVLWLAPFMIVLCFEMGMGCFSTGLFSAVSTLGLAAGMVCGGRLSDASPGNVRTILVFLPLVMVAVILALLVIITLFFSGRIGVLHSTILLMPCFLFLMFAQGMIQSAQIKYAFALISEGGTIAFSFLASLQNILSSLVLGVSIILGSWAAAHTEILKSALFPSFHYLHLIFACSIASGLLASIILKRVDLFGKKAEE